MTVAENRNVFCIFKSPEICEGNMRLNETISNSGMRRDVCLWRSADVALTVSPTLLARADEVIE